MSSELLRVIGGIFWKTSFSWNSNVVIDRYMWAALEMVKSISCVAMEYRPAMCR